MSEEIAVTSENVSDIQKIETDCNEKDIIEEIYSQHGGDPRKLEISYVILLSRLPTDFLADTYEQFLECIKNLLSEEHKLDPASLKQVIRIPKLDTDAPNQSNALRVLLCFTEKTHKHRMMGRKKDVECAGMLIETLEALPAEFLEISEEDRHAFESGEYEMADEVGEDEFGEDENYDEDGNKVPKNETDFKEGEKGAQEPQTPKKKVYNDGDENAPFEVSWEGAPEFQWRICDGVRDEKKLIIDNIVWADIYSPFIYRCIQHATSTDISFPARYTSDASKACYGKLTAVFPGWVSIMDEALKHLIYFRSSDGRRIKIYLPQTGSSLSKKDEFEAKLGRLIKPTQRMKELVVKILPEGYIPTLDDACAWFPFQSVIGCELVADEMGQSCAIVKFETADEAIAAHSGKSFIAITQTSKITDSEGSEKETTKSTNCNIFMRGVEAHFGSLITFYDQKKRMFEEREAKRKEQSSAKRPAGSTIRGPSKRGRGSSPVHKGPSPKSSRGARRGRGGPVRRPSPPRRPPPRSIRGGRGDSRPRKPFRGDSYGSSRGPARTDAFGNYGYSQFNSRFNERTTVDPFGRPLYGVGNNSYPAPFNDSSRSFGSGYDNRRRY